MSLAFIATAIGLGIAYAAAPGAVNTEAIRRGVTYGARPVFLVESGSLLGDALWAVLALTGITLLAQALPLQIVLGIGGGFFLLRMGWLALHEAFARRHEDASTPSSKRGHFVTGLIFGLANPVGLAFWLGVGSSVAGSGVAGTRLIIFMLGFFVGATLWCLGITAVIRWGRRWVRPALFRWVNALCGLALGYFGIRVLWEAIQQGQTLIQQMGIPALESTRQAAACLAPALAASHPKIRRSVR